MLIKQALGAQQTAVKVLGVTDNYQSESFYCILKNIIFLIITLFSSSRNKWKFNESTKNYSQVDVDTLL